MNGVSILVAETEMIDILSRSVCNGTITILKERIVFANAAVKDGAAASAPRMCANVPAGQSEIFVMLATNEKLPGLLS